jgi:hypothetical protein
VTTLVFLTGDDATAALAAKVAAAAAPSLAAHVAAARSAVAGVPGAMKLAAAAARAPAGTAKAVAAPGQGIARVGKGTQKMSDNWKINENVPDSPTYADLQREVDELEKEEKQHFNTRAASMTKAMTTADTDGDKAGLKNLKWKNAKDKYEQAAFKDIMDEEKERIKDTITEQGAQMFQQYEQKAQALMGTDELKELQNSTAIAEEKRSMAEKSALVALRSAHVQLKKVEAEEEAARDKEDKEKQERANAKMAAHLQAAVDRESGSEEYYKKMADAKEDDAKRSSKQREAVASYQQDYQALRSRDGAKLGPEHKDTPYHKDYLEAESEEDKRNAAFAAQIEKLKNRVEAQRQARAKLLKAVEGESHKEEVMRKDEVHKEDKKALKTSRSEEAKMDYVLKDGAKAEEQVKAVLEAGAKAEEQVTSESDYQSTVQAAMEADLRRRARERKMREEFRAKRAERLFQDDSSNTAKIEASMDKVANAVMQPGQLVNAARARQSDGTGLASRIIKDRESEVNLIVGK